MKRTLMLIAVSAAISTAVTPRHVAGQTPDTRSDAVACRDSVSTGMYRRCALWMDGNRVRRGEDGVFVGRPGFLRPMALTRLVAGDSAMSYAALFEHRSRQSGAFLIAGGALMAAGLIVLDN